MRLNTTYYVGIAALTVFTLSGCKTAPPPQTAVAEPTTPSVAAASASSYLMNLNKRAPNLVSVGDEFTYELIVTALRDVAEATVVHTLPEGASFISSDPSAQRDGNRLTWKLGDMNRDETKTITVRLKAEKQGELVNSATVAAIPRAWLTTVVGRPQLAMVNEAPAMARVGQEFTSKVVVRNTGNILAKDVVVTDTVPDGLSGPNGQKQLTFNIGEIPPGGSKDISIALTGEARGKISNKVLATSSNAGTVEAEGSTTIVQAGLKIAHTTKDKEIFVNRAAAYDLVVSNPGDIGLSGIVVTHTAAPETVLAAAEGATVSGNTGTWTVGELKAGEQKTFVVKVLSKVPGKFTHTANVASAEGLSDSMQESTTWKGVTGILLEMVDDPDPIQVGETTKYTVRVTNQGATSDISSLDILVTVSPELEVVPGTVSDGGTVDGAKVTWSALPNVAPKASVLRSFIVKGIKAGDARSVAAIRTSIHAEPIQKVESTTVY